MLAKNIFLSFVIVFISTSSLFSQTLSSISLKKKEKKIYPMGKRIFEKRCHQDIDLQNYTKIEVLQNDIKKLQLCKPLQEKQLQAVVLYLFEVKKIGENKTLEHIQVSKDEKCPICGMFIYKYPRWATQIFYAQKHYSFDGVKDLLKYYFEHSKGITKILVNDYYSQKTIDGKKAYYVIGSDIYGPMGNELIPFKNKQDAHTFYMDHRGSKVIEFKDITVEEVYKLDE